MRSGSARTRAVLAATLVCAAWQAMPARTAPLAAQGGFYPEIPMATALPDPNAPPVNFNSPPNFDEPGAGAANAGATGPAAQSLAPSGPVIGNSAPSGPAPNSLAPSGSARSGGWVAARPPQVKPAAARATATQQPPTPVEDPAESQPAARKQPQAPAAPGAAPSSPAAPNESATADAAATSAPASPSNPALDPRFPGDPGPLYDDTSIARGIRDFFAGRSFPTEGRPAYTVSASALLFERSLAKSVPLVTGVGGGTLLDAGGLGLGLAVGPRIDVTAHFASGYDFQFIFYGLEGWHTSSQLALGPDSMQVPIFANDRFSTLNTSYSSRLFNQEINSKHAIWGPINILSGFRAIELNENLNLAGAGLMTHGSGNIKTRNWLLGLQLGLDAVLFDWGAMSVDAFLKGGIYINPARVTTNQSGNVDLASGSDNGANEAFAGDLGVNLNYRLPRDWNASIGYQALWLDRVALAPNQAATLPTVNFRGDAFFSGLQLGLIKPF